MYDNIGITFLKINSITLQVETYGSFSNESATFLTNLNPFFDLWMIFEKSGDFEFVELCHGLVNP